jgi:antitoxin (DNA-binding transcriptional repressor) of toxin-antitoxin stability system
VTPLQRVRDALDAANCRTRDGGRNWTCPSHEDANPSLSVTEGRDGRVLLRCHAGCEFAAIVAAIGLQPADLAPARDVEWTPFGEPVATYRYVDQRGKLLYGVCRFEPKTFRQWRPDESKRGGRAWSVRGVTLVPYRLPELLAAVADGRTIHVVEGEKDVAAIVAAGGEATTFAMGAGKWRPGYAKWFEGADVVVVADDDEPGRQHAATVAKALAGTAATVRTVKAAAGKDAADHLAAGHALDDFAPLEVEDAEPADAADAPVVHVGRAEGAGILAGVEDTYRRFVHYVNDHQAVAVTLWTAHTHAIDAFDVTPYLYFKSPEPESGKTRNFEVGEHLVARPWRVVEASEAVVFRKIDAERPTVMLDEVDALFGDRGDGREGLRGVLNEGYRRGATVPRCVGEGQTLTDFAVFCAKAFAGIGNLPRTIATRSIPIHMQRRAKFEHVERFSIRHTPPTLWPLRDRLAAWIALVADELAHAKPGMPASLSDRQVDIWEPLLAIADAAGGDWPTRARTAAVQLHGHDPTADPGIGALLLTHIREVFDAEPTVGSSMDAMASDRLLRALTERDDGPWGDWWAGDVAARNVRGPASKLAKLLRPYGIKPDQVWTYDGKVRGYRRAWFAKAFELYIPIPADAETVGDVPTDPEDGRTVDPRSEALSDLRRDNPDSGADLQPTVLPFSQTVGGATTVPEPMFDADDHRDPGRWSQ